MFDGRRLKAERPVGVRPSAGKTPSSCCYTNVSNRHRSLLATLHGRGESHDWIVRGHWVRRINRERAVPSFGRSSLSTDWRACVRACVRVECRRTKGPDAVHTYRSGRRCMHRYSGLADSHFARWLTNDALIPPLPAVDRRTARCGDSSRDGHRDGEPRLAAVCTGLSSAHRAVQTARSARM